MKNLSFFGKIIFWCNSIVVLLVVVSFILPYMPPKDFPYLSLLSLAVSPLLLLTFLFGLYWLVQLKKQFLLSTFLLVVASFIFNPFYLFSSQEEISETKNTLSILSYNVRLFNAYEDHIDETNISETLKNTVTKNNPDVIFIQEYYRETTHVFPEYMYRYVHHKKGKAKLGHAIFSKYPLINTGAFDFEKVFNNTLFADIVKGNDTLRLYNLHLRSLSVKASVHSLQEANKNKLFKRVSNQFIKQQNQVEAILAHKSKSPYPVILAGDFNNTAFSYIYRKLQTGMKDAFIEKGNGLGTTFRFDSYPMRIDYIFTSNTLEVLNFTTLKETFSDHYPVMATVQLN